MDRTNMMLVISMVACLISTVVSSMYIPSTSGTIPQEESPEDFNKRQQQMVYASTAFKSTMASLGIGIVCVLLAMYRGFIIDERNEARYQRDIRVKPILKVSRSRVVPIEVIVDDPKPQVKTTPQLNSVPAPSSSPPIQLIPDTLRHTIIPRGPVVQIVPHVKFKYPPPYDRVNRG